MLQNEYVVENTGLGYHLEKGIHEYLLNVSQYLCHWIQNLILLQVYRSKESSFVVFLSGLCTSDSMYEVIC